MTVPRSAALSAAFLLLFSSMVVSTPDKTLDLPITKDAPGVLVPAPVTTNDETQDPRDEPPPVFYGEEIETPSDSIVYVLDYSCSMGVGDRLEKAQEEFERSVGGLPQSMRFGVVLYSCQILDLPVVKATPPNKAEAIRFVHAWYPNSGTATGPGTARGLSLDRANMTIVLLTDGEPNCGAEGLDGHRRMIRNMNIQRATVNVFGIAASGTWRSFCQDVARDNSGSYTDVP